LSRARIRGAASCAGAWLLAVALVTPAARAQSGPSVREALGPLADRVAFGVRYEEATRDELWRGGSGADRDALIAEAFASGGRHGELDLYSRTRAWTFEGRVRLHDRLDATLALPWIEREHRHMLVHAPFFDPRFVDSWTYDGLGDATLLGHFRALAAAAGASLTLKAGAKLPTGRRHLPDEERTNFGLPSELHPSARPGSGSTDWLAGARWSQPLPWRGAAPLTANLLARWNGRGTDDYQVGGGLEAALGAGWSPPGPVTLLGQLQYAARGDDRSGHGGGAHAGERALHATPGVSVQVAPALAVWALVPLRVWGETDEPAVIARRQLLLGTTLTPPR